MDQPACTRRWFLELGIYAGVVTLCAPESRAQTETPTTPSTILGPYYPVIRPVERDTDLTRLSGHRSREGANRSRSRAHPESAGRTAAGGTCRTLASERRRTLLPPVGPKSAPVDPDFQGYGVQVTDRNGRFRFTTIKPGPYPFEGGTRAPHLHFQITGRAERRVTQMFFAGEALNDRDQVLQAVPRRRESLVADLLPAPPYEDPATRLIHWDIVLRRG